MKKALPAVLVLASVLISFLAVEVFLSLFLPLPLATIGQGFPPNASLYGWGYAPGARILVSDPDSGQIFSDYANSRGWRDREHDQGAAQGVTRILVLGDSNTFGANVAAGKVYPRVLDRLLDEAGLRAEVIVMAYGGWSTDQELEALIHEGLNYRPDIVVVQFTINDLAENTFVPQPGTRDRMEKPYYYLLGESGELQRKLDTNFSPPSSSFWNTQLKSLASRSEILKRLYVLYDSHRQERNRKPLNGYPLDYRQITRARLAFEVSGSEALGRYLESNVGKELDRAELERQIDLSPHAADKVGLLTILGDVWINQYWEESKFYGAPPDETSYEWRIYKALMYEMRRRIPASTPLLLLSDHEQGLYDWEISWHRIATDKATRENFLAVNRLLEKLGDGIELVPTPRPHPRFHLDPHPNSEGHEAMAQNLFDYLTAHHAGLFRKP